MIYFLGWESPERIRDEKLISALPDLISLEGLSFPKTYSKLSGILNICLTLLA